MQIDSKFVVEVIHKNHMKEGPSLNLMRIIRQVGRSIKDLHIEHIYMKVNRCAKTLVKQGSMRTRYYIVYDGCPS